LEGVASTCGLSQMPAEGRCGSVAVAVDTGKSRSMGGLVQKLMCHFRLHSAAKIKQGSRRGKNSWINS